MHAKTFGVVVARFQTPELHAGHRHLLETVHERHRRMIVVLGTARTYVPTDKNPLDFATRRAMVLRHHPTALVTEVRDNRSDALWSHALDAAIAAVCGAEAAARGDVVLYGSRDSFLRAYSGSFESVALPAIEGPSATDLRLDAIAHPLHTPEFRSGAIYVATTRPPVVYPTVDVAILDRVRNRVLFGRKREDGGQLRFIGGFVSPTDASLEAAAKREAMEETGGLELGAIRYVGSHLVDDWRYCVGKDRIVTTLYAVDYVFGHARGTDDNDEAVWIDASRVVQGGFAAELVPEHRPLGAMLAQHLISEGGKAA